MAFAFPLWPESPALGILGITPNDEHNALSILIRVGAFRSGYVIASSQQQPLWGTTGAQEFHMTVQAEAWQPVSSSGVRRASLAELDRFYAENGAGAWHPIQFETGPYVVFEEEGEILAAAGTHFTTPGLAQVGNVFTAPTARGRGLAKRCTSAVVEALFERGHVTVSLFVNAQNTAALSIYRQLGFKQLRTLHAFHWHC